MDTPALPPHQGDLVTVVASTANSAAATEAGKRSPEPPSPAIPATVSPTVPDLVSWLSSSQLARSFDFVGKAFKTALVGNVSGPQRSTTVPVRWARSADWKRWAAPADIEVSLVIATPQAATEENESWSVPFAPQCLPEARRRLKSSPRYRISLKDKTLGYVADKDKAYALAQQLKRLIRQSSLEGEEISFRRIPSQGTAEDHLPVNWAVAAEQLLFYVDESMAAAVGYSKEWAAIAWANNLRIALDAEPLDPGEAQMTMQNLQASDQEMTGEASWYGPYFHGRRTANGEIFDQNELTVAHKSLPFGTHIKVRNLLNDRTVVVRVNDRGPYVGDRSLDLSKAAADCLGSAQTGVIPYEAVILEKVGN